MTPCLYSTRLILYPYTPMLVTPEHVDWLNNRDLMQYSEQRLRPPHTMVTQMAYAKDVNPNRHVWLIRYSRLEIETIPSGGKDIGTISAYVDEHNRTANLGILLGSREHHGMGLAAESWCAVIEWLFTEGDIHKVACGTRDDNYPMRRLATTTGMTLEAEIPGHFKVGDTWRGLVLYGRFKHESFHSEWQKMWQPPYWKPEASS